MLKNNNLLKYTEKSSKNSPIAGDRTSFVKKVFRK